MKKTQSTIAIVAGGTLDVVLLSEMRKADFVIGVDRGAWWLLQHGVVPDAAVGDFDSVTPEEFARIEKRVHAIVRHPPEKDETDLELAARYAADNHARKVKIYGALGSRFDHGHAGVHVLRMLASYNIKGYIVDNFCKISIVVRRIERVEKDPRYAYVSVFPFGGDAIISLKGFKYPVTRRRFATGSTLGVSNEVLAEVGFISVHKGTALVVQSRD